MWGKDNVRDREDASEINTQRPYVTEISPTLMYFMWIIRFARYPRQFLYDERTCSTKHKEKFESLQLLQDASDR